MKNFVLKLTAISLVLITIFAYAPFTAQFAAAEQFDLNSAIADTAVYLTNAVPAPQADAVGGAWTVISLARSGEAVPDGYFEGYYTSLCRTLNAKDGVLNERRYDEYPRTILALAALGYNPSNMAKHDLLLNLSDFARVSVPGVGGSVMALIALDSAAYDIPINAKAARQARRDLYLADTLSMQLPDGGFSADGIASDPATTAIVLQALAGYTQRDDIKIVLNHAIKYLSEEQQSSGGFGGNDLEACAQTLIALCELGINVNDSRFVKDGNTLLGRLAAYYKPGQGFSHTIGGASNISATEQALCAMVAVRRVNQGKPTLYHMVDVKKLSNPDWESADYEPVDSPVIDPNIIDDTPIDDNPIDSGPIDDTHDDTPIIDISPKFGLPGKDKNVMPMPVSAAERTFEDIAANDSKTAILNLAARGIINGKTDIAFDPDATMTRAEFAAIIVRAMGMEPMTAQIVSLDQIFDDVALDAWYSDYIKVAYHYGIIKGTSASAFSPNSTITKEEAAVMIERAAELCGMYTYMPEDEVFEIISHYADSEDVAGWALPSVTMCFKYDLLPQSATAIAPKSEVRRYEIAEMVFRMLKVCDLI